MAPKLPSRILSPLQLVEYFVESTIAAGPEQLPFEYHFSLEVFRGPGPVWRCPVPHVCPSDVCDFQRIPKPNRHDRGVREVEWIPRHPDVVREQLTEHLLTEHNLNGRIRNTDGWRRTHASCANIQGLESLDVWSLPSRRDSKIRTDVKWWQEEYHCDAEWGDKHRLNIFATVMSELTREVRAAGFTIENFTNGSDHVVYLDRNMHPWLGELLGSAKHYVDALNTVRAVLGEVMRENRKQQEAARRTV